MKLTWSVYVCADSRFWNKEGVFIVKSQTDVKQYKSTHTKVDFKEENEVLIRENDEMLTKDSTNQTLSL